MTARSRGWARHYQDDWQARAGDPRLPYWLRVASLAFGSHAENGHARFKQGEVALILGAVDQATGQIHPFTNLRREIARAVEFGWLVEGSYWGCLIVPAHSIRKGDLARNAAPCPLAKSHGKRANRSPSERFGVPAPTPSERFDDETAHPVSGSERKPLYLICPPTPPTPSPRRNAS